MFSIVTILTNSYTTLLNMFPSSTQPLWIHMLSIYLVIVKDMGYNAISLVKSNVKIMKLKLFCLMLGGCLWMVNTLQLDIVYVVHVLQLYQVNPGIDSWTTLVRLLDTLLLFSYVLAECAAHYIFVTGPVNVGIIFVGCNIRQNHVNIKRYHKQITSRTASKNMLLFIGYNT